MTVSSEALIAAEQPARIAKRLLNHWKHKFDTAEDEHGCRIIMPSAVVQLLPEQAHLTVRILPTQPETDLPRLEQVVLDHLSRMGQTALTADWLHQEYRLPG